MNEALGKKLERRPDHKLTVFISYGHDCFATFVQRVKELLEARGHEVWIDTDALVGGSTWMRSMERGIDAAVGAGAQGRFLFFAAPYGLRRLPRNKGFCHNEVEHFVKFLGEASEPPPGLIFVLSDCRMPDILMPDHAGAPARSTGMRRALDLRRVFEGASELRLWETNVADPVLAARRAVALHSGEAMEAALLCALLAEEGSVESELVSSVGKVGVVDVETIHPTRDDDISIGKKEDDTKETDDDEDDMRRDERVVVVSTPSTQPLATTLTNRLREKGWDVRCGLGDEWWSESDKNINWAAEGASGKCVVLLSHEGSQGKEEGRFRDVVTRALETQLEILPVLAEKCRRMLAIISMQYVWAVDAKDPRTLERVADMVAAACRGKQMDGNLREHADARLRQLFNPR